MKKSTPSSKASGKTKTGAAKPTKPTASKPAAKKSSPRKGGSTDAKAPAISPTGTLQERMAAAKKLEALDRPTAGVAAPPLAKGRSLVAAASSSKPQRNSDFPNTFIQEISVRLEDPDHPVTLTWAGPNAATQETGPFRSSPGAGLTGLNCDSETTSRRSGSNCTPKGTFKVTGFAAHLNSHPEATNVTWFVPARAIALHYYPTVPKFAASHGCVRLEKRRVAQLIQNNSRAGVTDVTVAGTWTKPAHQH